MQLELNFLELYYDKHAKHYYNNEKTGNLFFQEAIQMPAIRSMLKEIKYHSVLDIGCGTGIYTRYFSDMDKSVTAIDISENMLDFAKKSILKKNNTSFIKDDFLTHDFGDKKFDLIFASFVINYFDDLDLFFKKIKKLLSIGDIKTKTKGGSVIITMLHPVRTSSKRVGYGKYIHQDYLVEGGSYLSNFLSDDEELPLIKYNFKQIIKPSIKNGLKIIDWDEPKIIKTNQVSNDELEFYFRNESIFIVQMNRK
jgi:ubiquinone/menaquinone biosynthesis C-methylase UbiE